jgi:hypothetical protein
VRKAAISGVRVGRAYAGYALAGISSPEPDQLAGNRVSQEALGDGEAAPVLAIGHLVLGHLGVQLEVIEANAV